MIKVVLVDYGGVLGSDSPILSEDPETSQKTGLSQKEILDLYWEFWNDLKVGNKDLRDYLKEVVKRSKHQTSVEELMTLHYQKIYIHNEIVTYVKNVKKQGIRVMILSNESREGMRQKVQKFHLDKVFEKVYCSADIGLTKPDNKIFEYVLKDLQIEPESVLLIDDSDQNIVAAKSIGLQTLLFRNSEQVSELLLS